VGEAKFKGEVVQGASEVMEAIPNDGGKRGGRRFEDFGPEDVLAALEVELGPRSARVAFRPGSLLGLKFLQVFRSPV